MLRVPTRFCVGSVWEKIVTLHQGVIFVWCFFFPLLLSQLDSSVETARAWECGSYLGLFLSTWKGKNRRTFESVIWLSPSGSVFYFYFLVGMDGLC